jgi:MATE family multidrug resistance protein
VTAGISGYSIYYGLATSLDTLCAQAYGSGAKHLVGVHLQRMVYFLLLVSIPITLVWFNGETIIAALIPESERPVAVLSGRYLRVIALGAPGFAMFEAGKRFVQAQGIFDANMYVLLFCAPLNIFMNWLFVWVRPSPVFGVVLTPEQQFRWGYIGAPIAVAITDNLLPVSLFLYVYFVRGRECWGGFSRAALRNWGPMIRLALPGLLMIVTEYLAFEILTLAASRLSATHLAAQSILATVAAMAYQLPWALSIAGSTRVANLIGAAVPASARVAARATVSAAFAAGLLNLSLLIALRSRLASLFTDDAGVAALVWGALPVCIAFQVFDSLTCACNGILRGIGRQEIGGYINISAYYAIAMPISFGTCFGLGWGLEGLWIGPAIALSLICSLEALFLVHTSWDSAVDQARKRNAMG